ncbi:MAG: hypothetical protein BJ554DRAFT_5735 [Olpidium bornovanus]|uniref:Uncharacterized protein n=1 Tax=Olpidium bornovanus TaxID=278681 RepID=A0A8H8DL99_9FUNG|nr:MAG: hypothetical protein BJ554DRAFT_5735 [Olpidium bornovanus]
MQNTGRGVPRMVRGSREKCLDESAPQNQETKSVKRKTKTKKFRPSHPAGVLSGITSQWHPCSACLDACNNGHFWMFHAEGIRSADRMDPTGT